MLQLNPEAVRMVEFVSAVSKLPDTMQALAMGYARGLEDARRLRPATPTDPAGSEKQERG